MRALVTVVLVGALLSACSDDGGEPAGDGDTVTATRATVGSRRPRRSRRSRPAPTRRGSTTARRRSSTRSRPAWPRRGASASSRTATPSSPSATPAGCCCSRRRRTTCARSAASTRPSRWATRAARRGCSASPSPPTSRGTARSSSTSAPPTTTGSARPASRAAGSARSTWILDGHPERPHPRRRPARVRAGRLPLRLHRRDRRSPSCAQDRVDHRRQDPADHHRRRAGAGQPVPGLADLVLRPPQRAGPGVRRRRPALGLGVRAERLRRAQPDPEGRELRLADGRGPRRGRRA